MKRYYERILKAGNGTFCFTNNAIRRITAIVLVSSDYNQGKGKKEDRRNDKWFFIKLYRG